MRLCSADGGESWTHQQTGTSGSQRAVTFGHGVFVAVGETHKGKGLISLSTDGQTWREALITDAPLIAATFGNGRFVCIDGKGIAYVSTNGEQWTQHLIEVNGPVEMLRYVNGSFLARSNCRSYLWSIDGQEWFKEEAFLPQSIVYGNAKYLGLSNDGYLFSATIMDTWSQSNGAILRFTSLAHRGLP